MSSHKSKVLEDEKSLRIVQQYRDKSSMIYELEGGGAELDVRISPRQTSDDSGDWRIEVRAGRASGATCIAEWASTRREALVGVARKWQSSEEGSGLPSFDWDAVAGALTKVRAL